MSINISYLDKHKNDMLKLAGFFFCLLMLFVIGNNYTESQGKEEFNSFLNDIDENSRYFLYETSAKAKEGKEWIDNGNIGSKFYQCIKSSRARTSGGAANSKNYYMVIKAKNAKDYLLQLNVLDIGKIYLLHLMYFKKYGLGHIRTNQTTEVCSLPNQIIG